VPGKLSRGRGLPAVAFVAGAPALLLLGLGLRVAAGFWVCGLAAGYVVQRSRLCFAGAIRDAFLWRMPSLARAVLVLLGAALVGVAAVQYFLGVPGNVLPVGWHTVAGGLVFGLGMGMAGACALTTLVRLGEGAVVYALAVAGLVVGGKLGLGVAAWWRARVGWGTAVFLPDLVGWPGAVLAGLGALALLAAAVELRGRPGRGPLERLGAGGE